MKLVHLSSHGQRSLVLDFPRLEDWSTHSSPNHLESYYLDHYSLIRQGKSEMPKGRDRRCSRGPLFSCDGECEARERPGEVKRTREGEVVLTMESGLSLSILESRISNNSNNSNSNIIIARLAHGETIVPLFERERDKCLIFFSTWPHIVQASL